MNAFVQRLGAIALDQFRGWGHAAFFVLDLLQAVPAALRRFGLVVAQVYAIGNRCSHAEVSLADGDVNCDNMELECIRHGSAFSLETGRPRTLPATQPVPVFVAEVRGDDVFISSEPTKAAS